MEDDFIVICTSSPCKGTPGKISNSISLFEVRYTTLGEACRWLGECSLIKWDKNRTFWQQCDKPWKRNGSAYDPKNTIPTVKYGGGRKLGLFLFSWCWQNPHYWREDEWSHVRGNSWEIPAIAIYQDNEDEMWVDLPTGWPKTYCKWDCQLEEY